MPKKRYNAEEIIHKLREADVLLSQGNEYRPNQQADRHSRADLLPMAQGLWRDEG